MVVFISAFDGERVALMDPSVLCGKRELYSFSL